MIESIHAQGTIHSTPLASISWAGAKGDNSALPNVQGLAEALRCSYAAEQTLAASGFSYADPIASYA